jgi:hypothetical protein
MGRDAFETVEPAPASAGRTAAALLVFLAVVAVTLMPAAIAWSASGGVAAPLAGALGGVAAVLVGLKLAAAAGGLLAKLLERPRLRADSASID